MPLVAVWGSLAGVVLIALHGLSVPMVVMLNLATGLLFLVPYLALTGGFRTGCVSAHMQGSGGQSHRFGA